MSKLIFEIGTEEIPSAALYKATAQMAKLAGDALEAAGLAHGTVETCSTPRRMILSVDDVAEATEAVQTKAKGPAAKIAFDEEGNPTKAAEGFARGKGCTAADLVVEADEKGVEYVYAVVSKPAVPALELLPGILAGIIKGLSWPRSQRWGSGHDTFSRPVRWLVALLGEKVVDVEFAGLKAGRTTYGHRFLAPAGVDIARAEDFMDALEPIYVVASAEKRAERIREQVAELEAETGLCADMPQGTFAEVVNLVEWPTAILAHFDEEFLAVPPEIITDAMLEHQRYFPMYRADGSLDNAFIVVGNGDPACSDTIRDGNERVVRARLADAKFFVDEDRRQPLEAYVDGLKDVTFQERLGSVYDKTGRIMSNAEAICKAAGIEATDPVRAALLCKADLITGAVVEFTSLQGIMGGRYARFSGESDDVALAVTDHYRPRFAGDDLPRNEAGKVVALADKIDTICGIFAIGKGPTGSSDPYALRRAAIGIIHLLLDGPAIRLGDLIDAGIAAYEGVVEFDEAELAATVRDFFSTRLEVIARDRSYAADVVQAVMYACPLEPVEALARIDALAQARDEQPELFDDLATAYTRASNLRDEAEGTAYDKAHLNEVQRALSHAIDQAEDELAAATANDDYPSALAALAGLRAPIDEFFDKVMVMDDDLAVRSVNMRLLNRFAEAFADIADIGKLAK